MVTGKYCPLIPTDWTRTKELRELLCTTEP